MSARFVAVAQRALAPLSRRGRAGGRPTAGPVRGPSSVFAKGLRDSRRACLLAGFGLGLFAFMYGSSIATNYPTAASRQAAVDALQAVSAIGAIGGLPIRADTIGGFLSWRVTSLFPLVLGVWSAMALTGTLAGEIRAGSFEVLGAAPISRRRIALEKIGAHLASLAIAGLLVALLLWLTGAVWARLPGDDIGLANAVAQSFGVVLLGLVGGAIAFAAAPFTGRAVAAALGTTALFAAFLVDSYRGLIPALESVGGLSWFAWLANERPLARSWDVAAVGLVAGLVIALLAVGVVAFDRRDVGSTVRLPSLRLPGRRFLLRGPGRESFLETGPAALAWGLTIGVYAWLAAVSGPGFISQFSDPQSARLMDQFFPNVEWRTAGGMLQFLFFSLGTPFMALAGATLVNSLASQEREGRLDLPVSAPVARVRWLVASGLGVYASLAALTLVVAAAVAAGVVASGGDAVGPFVGTWVGGLYALALAGLGLAVFGLGRPGLAAAATAGLAVGFTAFDLLGSSLRLPSELLSLSLSRHLGQPMAGAYDWPGMMLAFALAIGGLLLGAWGLRRRDLSY
jgi:putative exporter of polyketide antibiotics